MDNEAKIREFRKMYPADQMAALFEKLLELQSKNHQLPSEITDRKYTVTEASPWVKMSPAWIRKQIYAGVIKENKGAKGKHLLTWSDVQKLSELRKSKFKA